LGQSTTVKSVPAITELSDWYLVELTEDLDDLAKKLGFAASPKEKMASYGVDPTWDPDEEDEVENESTAN